MGYRLFLDDERDPPRIPWRERLRALFARLLGLPPSPDVAPWTVVRSYEAAIAVIAERGLPQHIAFDHDLGLGADGKPDRSGYDLAKWIVEYVLDHDSDLSGFTWYVHSQNPAGARNIDALLTNLKSVVQGRRDSASG